MRYYVLKKETLHRGRQLRNGGPTQLCSS